MAGNEPFYTGPWGNRAVMGPDDWIVRRDTYKAMILSDGPVGYWRLGEASGNAADNSGQGNTLAANGTITYSVAGAIFPDPDTACTFDGVTGFFSIAIPAILSIIGVVTVGLWIKRTNHGNTHMLVRAGVGAGDEYYGLLLDTSQKLQFSWFDGAFKNVTSTATITDGVWTHVAATRDGSNNIALYINGKPDNTGAGTAPTVAPVTFQVGAAPAQFTPGTIDEVTVFNKLLSPNRILQHALGSPAATGYPRNI